jgi:hypothetical protein
VICRRSRLEKSRRAGYGAMLHPYKGQPVSISASIDVVHDVLVGNNNVSGRFQHGHAQTKQTGVSNDLSSFITQAHLKMSAALLYSPCRTSGAKYSLSPSRSNEAFSPALANSFDGGRGHREAIPKSPILNRPSSVTNMFAGLRSK